MVRVILIASILLSFEVSAQSEDYIRPGLLKATATISPSKMLARDFSNIYISGFAEYYVDKKLSFRGDTYLFVDGQDDFPFFDQAFRTFFGLHYHLNKNNFDVNFGFQPGLSYMKRNPYMDGIETFAPIEEKGQFMPSFSLSTGVTYYVWKYFNFFANVTYIRSDLNGSTYGHFNTDELVFSAGLGFQVNTRKQ